MDNSYLYLVVGYLFKRLLYGFYRALNVRLYDYRKLLHFALGDLVEEVVKSYLLILLEYLLLGFLLALFNKLSCKSFVRNGVDNVACRGNLGKTCYLNRNAGSCLGDVSSFIVNHCSYSAHCGSGDDDVAQIKGTVLNKHGGNRTSALIQPCFDDRTLCKAVGVGFKL